MTTGRITAVAIVAAALAWAGDATAQSSTTGAVTIYTAGPKNLADTLARGFTAKTHARVNLFQATTGKIMARLAAEQANPQCDVLISAAWETAVAMKAKGQLLAYESPNAAKVPAMLKDGSYVAQGAAALAIIWNAKSGKPKPRDWSDLAMASYKDAVTMPDPAASGSAFGLVSGLAANQGFGWKFFKTLKSNGAFVAGANAAALNPVMQGAKAAVFGGVDYISLGARAKGEAIDVIYPASGTVLEARPMMILKSTKNAALAKRFIDYALSDDGQKLVANVYLLPARTDVAARRPGWKDIKLLPEQAENAAGRARTLAQFKTVMGVK